MSINRSAALAGASNDDTTTYSQNVGLFAINEGTIENQTITTSSTGVNGDYVTVSGAVGTYGSVDSTVCSYVGGIAGSVYNGSV